jgi:hypothetical protein
MHLYLLLSFQNILVFHTLEDFINYLYVMWNLFPVCLLLDQPPYNYLIEGPSFFLICVFDQKHRTKMKLPILKIHLH